MERTTKTNQKKKIKIRITDFTLRYWRSMIQVFEFFLIFCFLFDMSVIRFHRLVGGFGGFERRETGEFIKTQEKHTYVQYEHFRVLQICRRQTRTCIIQLRVRKKTLSPSVDQVSSLQPVPNNNNNSSLLPYITYLRGKYILLIFFQFVLKQNKKNKTNEKFFFFFRGYDPSKV